MSGVAHSIRPLTAETWPAFTGMVERHNGIFGDLSPGFPDPRASRDVSGGRLGF